MTSINDTGAAFAPASTPRKPAKRASTPKKPAKARTAAKAGTGPTLAQQIKRQIGFLRMYENSMEPGNDFAEDRASVRATIAVLRGLIDRGRTYLVTLEAEADGIITRFAKKYGKTPAQVIAAMAYEGSVLTGDLEGDNLEAENALGLLASCARLEAQQTA